MDTHCTHIPYSETGFFSLLVLDYLQQKQDLQQFYTYSPDEAGVNAAINDRPKYPVNREVLVSVLKKQYENIPHTDAVKNNIDALLSENTFTICTAHQPNLLTGYLYFIYKIAHAITLANELNEKHPDKHFVPVYYMGSEDNDLDELGTFRYAGKKFVWDADGQTGAVGRMTTKSLKPVLENLFKVLGPPGVHTEELKEILTVAYLQHDTIGGATQYLVNELFGRFGLVVLDPDDAAFKNEIKQILVDDLLNHKANDIVTNQAGKLAEQYKAQAYPRPINLFYLNEGTRERIERNGDTWQVLNTDISWNERVLLQELEAHPERFSPNVILRGVFQESIMPNVAFIGGGAEVAYWLQLKEVFKYYNVFYPVLLLRQSALWVTKEGIELQKKSGLSTVEMFKTTEQLTKDYIAKHSDGSWQTGEERKEFEKIVEALKQKAVVLDSSLAYSASAVLKKIEYQLDVLEKKMLRAEKRRHDTELQRIAKVKNLLFPNNSLQERYENFIEYYALYGKEFIDEVVKHTGALRNEFIVITD